MTNGVSRGGTGVHKPASLKSELWRYGFVGASNAILTFCIFFTMLKILNVNYLVSLFTSWLCGMIFSYCMNFKWVFSQPDRLVFDARFLKFAVCGALSITMNMLALRFIVQLTKIDPFWAQTSLIPAVVAFNFLSTKLWSLARLA